MDNIELIKTAINNRNKLSITFYNNNGCIETRILHPYILAKRNIKAAPMVINGWAEYEKFKSEKFIDIRLADIENIIVLEDVYPSTQLEYNPDSSRLKDIVCAVPRLFGHI